MSESIRDYLSVPGGRLYYEVDGDPSGPVLTLIHAGVAHLRMWDEQVPPFVAAGYRAVRYDTRGFGRTETEDVPFSNRDDLAALLDHLGVRPTNLLGLSRGGTIALDFTLEHPDRIGKLVIAGSTPSGFELEDLEMAPVWERAEALEQAGDWEALVELEADVWLEGPGQPRGRAPAELRQRMIAWGRENYTDGRGYGQPRPLDPPATGRLSEVDVPTLVIWGDLDEAGVLAGGPTMAAAIPDARRHVFPGVAHMSNLERPAEFTRLVLDFLAEGEPA
ncbi:MAG: hypothetical protein QOH61_2629 [Chloroflexota bacterium]|jgi:pimeloyl-ACP methyl ester carboxylesterase|nr:hypothetical protein [Chloroflexota bacterium]